MARNVVILGGTGKMGRWFAKFLKDKGLEVAIHSRSSEKAAKTAKELHVRYIKSIEAVRDADIVVVSTSLASTADIILAVSKKMRPNAILFDIASVKGKIIQALEEARSMGIRTISVHPMFGPGATSLKGKHVIVIPVGDDPVLVNEILCLFEGAETHILNSGEEHDRIVALTISLPHFLNIVFGKTLAKVDVKEVIKFAGTTFALQLLVTEAVFIEDPDLYYEIQSQNRAFKKVLDTFLKSASETTLTIKRKDREAFIESFKEVKASLSKDQNFVNAYGRFYKAYEALT
ncbi:MAG: prephenate dehydrogenase/arogenate dehydrogenase family protein [Candidatus Bathyarchaeota archaeon]